MKTPSTSVKISQAPPRAAASATAVVSEPPRPSVVTSWESAETPWNPATSTILPASSASLIRVARTSAIFALPWAVSVTMPACEPVSEMAWWPMSCTAIAQSAFEIRSPTEMSMSYSRGCGRVEISCASRISSSVVSPIAERTPTTRLPRSRACTSRRATSLIFSVSATEVPPNFITRRSGRCAVASAAISGSGSYCVLAKAYISLRPARARPSVTSSAYSRSPPTGSPLARRVTRMRSGSRPAR